MLKVLTSVIWHLTIVEGQKYHHSNRLVEPVRMVVFMFFYDHWMLRYLMKRKMAQQKFFKFADFSTFRQISRHPVVVEGQKYRHSNSLVESVRMVVFLSFYDR